MGRYWLGPVFGNVCGKWVSSFVLSTGVGIFDGRRIARIAHPSGSPGRGVGSSRCGVAAREDLRGPSHHAIFSVHPDVRFAGADECKCVFRVPAELARPVAFDDTVPSLMKVPFYEVGSNSNTPGFIVLSRIQGVCGEVLEGGDGEG